MKKLLLVITLLLLSTVSCAGATDVNFSWDYVNGTVPAQGFELRIATITNGVPTITIDCGLPTLYVCTSPQMAAGAWFAKLYAYATDATGKIYSGPSNELQFTLLGKPGDPTNLKVKK